MNDEVRAKLRAEIEARGLTHAQLAALIGTNRPQVTRYMTGERGNVTPEFERMLAALGFRLTLERLPAAPDEKRE
ncbi:helix-turn-helix transcriptional regulator [Deinococcus sp. 12RED42]|uniref:helix-turn-helix transcriptional regulator n=1 Tax=Deinococcus sp. 12RED42 TaxID=2745872 RepID=UPI001E327F36|nr:helix-turn-helix domain-containing protein [Deinococcus sp. 12RED42]